MDLRDLTRESEQSRRATERALYEANVEDLLAEQDDLVWRTEKVVDDIIALPDGEADFGRELERLRNAAKAMQDASERLNEPTTGPITVAAETEAIEHLLEARRGGGGGGGGGSTPGGGLKKGQTDASALALVGRTADPLGKVGDREVVAATVATEGEAPAELRGSLDRYFERLNGK